jgi:hypothetical protein
MTLSGSVIMNDVTEKQLSKIQLFKIANEGKFFFNPTAMQVKSSASPLIFNQVNVSWNSVEGMKLVLDLVSSLQSE